jgi:ribosomal protein S18 acetylase RimI-like enzyme
VPLPILLRPATPNDEDFLFRVYASTRREEIALCAWPPAQQAAFLAMQFQSRRCAYTSEYPGAERSIILIGTLAVGSTIVSRSDLELRVIDIALLPEYRNQGIGAQLLGEFIYESAGLKMPVRLSVLKGNPAIRLYERLGFVLTADSQVYCEMECWPERAGAGMPPSSERGDRDVTELE